MEGDARLGESTDPEQDDDKLRDDEREAPGYGSHRRFKSGRRH